MVRSMMLRNSHVRAFDKFFDDAWSHWGTNPFAVMDNVLDSITKPIPPNSGLFSSMGTGLPTKTTPSISSDSSSFLFMLFSSPPVGPLA